MIHWQAKAAEAKPAAEEKAEQEVAQVLPMGVAPQIIPDDLIEEIRVCAMDVATPL